MKKCLPIGIDNFKEIIDGNYYLVDKTLLIKELIDQGNKVTLFPRPRRFGKTLNMRMIQCFFEFPISRSYNQQAEPLEYLFRDKLIWADENVRKLQGKFPVIFISFKDVKQASWAASYEKIIEIIVSEYGCHRYLLESNVLSIEEKKDFHNILAKQASQSLYENSLKNLSIYLQRHYQAKVVVLVDEYDAPIHAAYLNKFYQDAVGFMRGLFCGVFKDNHSLERGVITGILRTAKEGIFSGLNNLDVYSILDEFYGDKFGFTQQEVATLLADYDLSENGDAVREWYNGYLANKMDPETLQPINLYNPWSLLNYANRKVLAAYWANTSDNALVKTLLTRVSGATHKELQSLLTNQTVTRKISDGFIFPGMEQNETAIWSLLVFSGYLTSAKTSILGQWYTCNLKIPNREIQGLYENLIQEIFIPVKGERIDVILRALVTGDVLTFHELFITFFANMMSFYDIPDDEAERSYHLFVLGMLTPLGETHEIRSNRESGQGRYDIMLVPHDRTKLGIIIEFKKVSVFRKETLESAADLALEQIYEKNYTAELKALEINNILAYGISVHGKQVLVKSEVIGAV